MLSGNYNNEAAAHCPTQIPLLVPTLLVKDSARWSMREPREPQGLQHCKNADNLVSNHIYRDGQSIATAENQNRRIKCRYFSDIRLGKQLQSLGVSDMKR